MSEATPADYRACVEYAMELLLGQQGPDLLRRGVVRYGQPEPGDARRAKLCILPGGLFGPSYGRAESLPVLPLREVEGVPLLYGAPAIQHGQGTLVARADVVASAFFLATRYEEVVRREVRDKQGRFPGRQSLACRAGFLDRPVVDEYAALLRKWLRAAGVPTAEPDREFSVLLSHDVDTPRKYWRRTQPLWDLLRIGLGMEHPRTLRESLLVPLGRARDPFDNFEEILALDLAVRDRLGPERCRQAYFFLAGGRGANESFYDVRDAFIGELIGQVSQAGAIVGLHASRNLGCTGEALAAQKALLEEVCGFPIRHNRCHYLAWREVEDGWALARAGLEWDSTLGYADEAGFRLGVCRPIPLFDPISLRPFGIEEHPLTIMECTLRRRPYMRLDEQEAFDYCVGLIQQARKHNGEVVLLWHNHELVSRPGNYHPRLYRRLLDALTPA